MAIDVLLTGFALFAAAFCVYFAWRAGEAAERAAHSEHRLSIMRGQVAGLCTSLEALDDKHKRLAGRVYADEYWRVRELGLASVAKDDHRQQAECDNWATAQRDGPSSPAAGCECEYCNARREERAQRRAKLRSGVKT